MTKNLTHRKLLEKLDYNPKTGEFKWKTSPKCNPRKYNELAGSYNNFDYLIIMIEYERYMAHRLAWLYITGEWPEGEIDHINGNRGDNRWCNLRLANRNQNQHNSKPYNTNVSGEKGVHWDERARKWRAQTAKNGQRWESYHDYWWQAVRAVRRRRKYLHGEYCRHE